MEAGDPVGAGAAVVGEAAGEEAGEAAGREKPMQPIIWRDTLKSRQVIIMYPLLPALQSVSPSSSRVRK
ncbi:hypothetical protein KSB_36110 [Ktedonobacter robiniae]|uniref:Uncharacterized protein n=1 Tax=Ktedonobacter robiniae TaxID=2778365 RepID=A0ABQ3UQX1_9CHLR|nr:hypothetical protein KSB_36110 [Ktedonobacter robiniae]